MSIKTRPATKEYREGWERTFGNKSRITSEWLTKIAKECSEQEEDIPVFPTVDNVKGERESWEDE